MRANNITAIMVLWNEERRIAPLIERLRPYVDRVVVGVQESADSTLAIALDMADEVVQDSHHGYGDATLPAVLRSVKTPWTFKVDGDEMPTEELMNSMALAVSGAEARGKNGIWIKFRSWIDDIEWESPHSHLRLFQTYLGWSPTLHSRPSTENTMDWKIGWIEHRKSLDEHVQDYLSYLRVGAGNSSWDRHNTDMLWYACTGTARVKGWDYVKAFPWWPQVEAAAFTGGIPEPPEL